MNYKKLALDSVSAIIGFAVGMYLYNKFLGGGSSMKTVSDTSASEDNTSASE